MDIRSMARSLYDPMRMQGEYRAEKKRLRDAFTDQGAAEYALPGSIAERNNPNQYGSVAGRFNGAFQPEEARALSGSSDWMAQQELDDTALIEEAEHKQKLKSRLRRRAPGDGGVGGYEDFFEGLL